MNPYDLEENYLRTDGRDVCHWCSLRPQEFVWGPYGTRVCARCEQIIEGGGSWEVVEEVAARITVRGGWSVLDPGRWRQREHGKIGRWLEVRTIRTGIHASEGGTE